MPCQAVGRPTPVVKWFIRKYYSRNINITTTGIFQADYGSLVLSPASRKHQNLYVCEAQNLVGRNSFIVFILVVPGILISLVFIS